MSTKNREWMISYQDKELVPCIRFDTHAEAVDFLDDLYALYTKEWMIDFDPDEFRIDEVIPVPTFGLHASKGGAR